MPKNSNFSFIQCYLYKENQLLLLTSKNLDWKRYNYSVHAKII